MTFSMIRSLVDREAQADKYRKLVIRNASLFCPLQRAGKVGLLPRCYRSYTVERNRTWSECAFQGPEDIGIPDSAFLFQFTY